MSSKWQPNLKKRLGVYPSMLSFGKGDKRYNYDLCTGQIGISFAMLGRQGKKADGWKMKELQSEKDKNCFEMK